MKVKEIKKTIYETMDGQQFDIESEAKEHEAEILSDYITIETAVAILQKHCEKTGDCSDCPFEDTIYHECKLKRDMPEDWNI